MIDILAYWYDVRIMLMILMRIRMNMMPAMHRTSNQLELVLVIVGIVEPGRHKTGAG